ncbi:DUF6769 family protein [Viscerimonas tarda]
MFKRLSILFVFAAILALMAHVVIPHHEHGETVCFEQTHTDTPFQDENEENAHACCLDTQDAIRAQDENQSAFGCHDVCCDFHFSPVLVFFGNFFDFDYSQPEVINKPYFNLYTSAEIDAANSLRGPPQV